MGNFKTLLLTIYIAGISAGAKAYSAEKPEKPARKKTISARIQAATQQAKETAAALVKPEPDHLKILRYVDNPENPNERLIMIKGGRDQGVVDSAIFKAHRRAASPTGKKDEFVWVETGTLKAIHLENDFTIAQILTETSLESKVFFPKYPGIMAGDWVQEHQVDLVQRHIITPTTTIEYAQLFEDPKAYPTTFELSDAGREILTEVASRFGRAHLPLLMVEAYTDINGPSDANQVESYQRALTIRHFLIEELGFDAARVIAIGYGEGEPLDNNLVPGYEARNRRIVLKVKSLAGDEALGDKQP